MKEPKDYRVLSAFWLNGKLYDVGGVVSLTPRDARTFFHEKQISELPKKEPETDPTISSSDDGVKDDNAENPPKNRGKRG